MSHGFGKCSKAKWVRVGGKKSWQFKCSRCGRLKIRKPLITWHVHRWKKDRRFKKQMVLKCQVCGKSRKV